MMDGGHTRGLELGEVEAKFVLHPGEGGCCQAEATHVVGVDGGKLRDARHGCGLSSRGTTAGGKRTLVYLGAILRIHFTGIYEI